MWKRVVCSCLIFLCAFSQLTAQHSIPVEHDLKSMLSLHVENKEITPLIYRRSLQQFIEQFDPSRIYLTEEEVNVFLDVTTEELYNALKQREREQYPIHQKLYRLFVEAIARARSFRMEAEAVVAKGRLWKRAKSLSARPESEQGLKEKWWAVISHVYRKAKSKETDLNSKEIFGYWERNLRSHEELYLQNSNFHLFVLKAFARSLDAHTAYFSEEEAFDLRARLKKEFPGVGIVVTEDVHGVFIKDILSGSPADKQKELQIGDQIVSVNGKAVNTLSYKEVLHELSGEEGSSMQLIAKRGKQSIITVMKREKLILESERITTSLSRQADGKLIGMIDLPSFYDNGEEISSAHDLKKALLEMKSYGVDGIVLDMRDNRGGFLTQAIKVAGMFISGGVIVISQYSDGEVRYSRNLDGRQIYNGPLVVLTSKGSASATEIVAQALQDYGVALIVGDKRTYGKGSMQYHTLIDPDATSYYKVTVGRYFTASGRSPQMVGVQADLVVPTKYHHLQIGEKYLQYPLSPDHLAEQSLQQLSNLRGQGFSLSIHDTFSHLKIRHSQWRSMIPTLKKQSQKRLANNQMLNQFLHSGKISSRASDWALIEAVEIAHDMAALSQKSQPAKEGVLVN